MFNVRCCSCNFAAANREHFPDLSHKNVMIFSQSDPVRELQIHLLASAAASEASQVVEEQGAGMSSSAQKKMQAVRGKPEKKSAEDMTEEERKHKAKIDKIKEKNKARKQKYKEMTGSPSVTPSKHADDDDEPDMKVSGNDWRDIGEKGVKDDKGCCLIA